MISLLRAPRRSQISAWPLRQLQVIPDAVEFDRKVLDGTVSSGELKKLAEGLASKAAAVGVPIAAICIGGSVVGLSAAGMTSGLAAPGFGGLLGLSSMATGIGVVRRIDGTIDAEVTALPAGSTFART